MHGENCQPTPFQEQLGMKMIMVLAAILSVGGGLGYCPAALLAQQPAGVGTANSPRNGTTPADPNAMNSSKTDTPRPQKDAYVRPTEKTKIKNYFFDAYGPYPIVGAALVAGINQADGTPPEWGQGWKAYGQRVGSNYGINAVSQTTRYALSEVLRQDTMYYRCDCTGFLPRLKHALISTLTARQEHDGHYVFSVPALIAPYAGTITATEAWYPARYSPKDGFRMGNYNLLAQAGGNIAIEFLFHGPHTVLSRMGIENKHAAPESEQQTPTPDH
jgi:hypothetical protein